MHKLLNNQMLPNLLTPPMAPTARPAPGSSRIIDKTRADAWRKDFEKEQSAILKSIKSVALGQNPHVSKQSATGGRPLLAASTAVPPPLLFPHQMVASDEHGSTYAGSQHPAGETELATALAFSQAGNASLALSAQAETRSSQTGFKNVALAFHNAIELFESHYKNKWPLRNVHLVSTNNGVMVWIRDSHLNADSADVNQLLTRMKNAFSQDGATLVSLTVNGSLIFERS
jgi:hypothetical protein